MKYKVEYSKTNDTYRVMDGDKIVTDFATKERAEAETKRLNGLQSVKDVDKAQEKKSLKEKIQELSLDQKAKLYFMGLVRQGKIDTLPEDPKAAYVSMMMDKDDYGRSISGKDKSTFMEPEDSMPSARARKMMDLEEGYNKIANKLYGVNYDKLSPQEQEYVRDTIDREPGGAFNPRLSGMEDGSVFEDLKEMATELGYLEEIGMFHDPLGYQPDTEDNESPSITDEDLDELLDIILKYVEDPDDAEAELDRFDQGGFDALSDMVAANLLRDPEYKAWDNKLHSINENKVEISYTDPGFRFYRMKVDGKRLDREEGTEYLKGLGIDMEIPRSYDESILDKIVAQLKEKGIDADHDAAMDVS
jgi:hypothetical protein